MTRLPAALPSVLLLALVACAAPGMIETVGLLPGTPMLSGAAVAEDYEADVRWMADDAREGRDTGTPGLYETAEFVAEAFAAAGLQPLGRNGSWFQTFTVNGRRVLLDGNALSMGGRAMSLHEDWIPMQSAAEADVSGVLVFAGYGIADAEGGHDDFAGLDLDDKVVLVLRKGPNATEEGSRYGPGGRERGRLSFASKINEAYRRGAAALICVNDPREHAPGTDADTLMEYAPIGVGGVAASLPAAHLTAAAGAELLAGLGLDLAEMQQDLDAGTPASAIDLSGTRVELRIDSSRPRIETVNVLGYLPGNDPSVAGEHVLIGAHMDHVGRGVFAPSRGGADARGEIHNGADDNASGTAGVIAAARLLGRDPHALRRGVVFATWSGEEWGLLGSRHYARRPALPLDDLVTAVNMDMIGRSTGSKVTVEGMGTATGFTELVVSARDGHGLPLELQLADKASGNSDHASFFEREVPVINFFTGLHEDYHMPSDDAHLVNHEDGARIATLAAAVVAALADLDERPVFRDPADDPDPVAAADPHAENPEPGASSAYRVVFGTSPDMAYQEEDGVRLAGVRANTPAARAGLQKGDLIVALDGKPIRNLEDYAVLLFSHRPGDTILVTIRRGEATLEKQAVLEGDDGEG